MLRRHSLFWGLAALAALAYPSLVNAQAVDVDAGQTDVQVDRDGVDVNADTNRTRIIERIRSTAGQSMNRQIAEWLIVDQQSLIELAKFGRNQTKNPQVRQLTDSIVQDHQRLLDQLSPDQNDGVGANDVSDRPSSADLSDARADRRDRVADQRDRGTDQRRERREDRRARDDDGDNQPRRESGDSGNVLDRIENLADRVESSVDRITDRADRITNRADQVVDEARDTVERGLGDRRFGRGDSEATWVAIHRQISEQLGREARADLEQRSGYEFDAALVGMIVASHLQQQATLEVLGDRATGELSETLTAAATTIKQHRQNAERVMAEIKQR